MKLELNIDKTPQTRQTTGQRIFDTLRQAIVQLQLRPGNSLSEADIAEQFGVSRQPVREAFIKLQDEGLVEIRPQRGTFVVMISRREVENARFIREAIEVAVVRKAVTDADQTVFAAIEKSLLRQRDALGENDMVTFLAQDDVFHRELARSVNCEHAWQVVERLKAQMDRVRYLSMPSATPIESLIVQHEAIFTAIKNKDSDQAEAMMRAHLSEILKSLPKIAEEHSDIFVD